MGVVGEQISSEEEHVLKLLISVICLYGKEGLPFNLVEEEFFNMCGFPIPWQYFGATDLRSWILTLPYIYILKDNRYNEDVLHEYSPKSEHIQELITKQKRSHARYICPLEDYNLKRKANVQEIWEDDCAQKFKKKLEECEKQVLHEDSFIHTSVNSVASTGCERYEKFEQLVSFNSEENSINRYILLQESMLPLFYKHQALGDEFFVDIADTKLGYYVSEKGICCTEVCKKYLKKNEIAEPRQTGLCSVGQTIAELTKKVRQAENLAPRVVVMIGFQDLLLVSFTSINHLNFLIINKSYFAAS